MSSKSRLENKISYSTSLRLSWWYHLPDLFATNVSAREPRKGIEGLRKARSLGIVTLFGASGPISRRQVGIEAEERHTGYLLCDQNHKVCREQS